MTKATLKPGIHEGIPFVEYLEIDAVNNTTLKEFDRSAKHARYALTHPKKSTKSTRMGDAAHVAILEPKRFKKEYTRSPKFNMRINKGKADAAAWSEKYGSYAALLPDEWDKATGMRDSVWAHPLASQLLKGKGKNELTLIWIDEVTGLLCKGRIDRLTDYMGYAVVLDIKSTKNGSVDGFPKEVANFAYHQQAAFYLDGLNSIKLDKAGKAIAPHERRFVHLVVENFAPYCVSLMELDDSALDEGRAAYRVALDAYAAAQETGEYPGYPVGIEGIDLPRWAYKFTTPPL